MSNFITTFNITRQTEGGYDPGDGETETYMGVYRSQNPNWPGWVWIDAIKATNPGASVSTLNDLFAADADLQAAIQQFYKANDWSTAQLDAINDLLVANARFDCSVSLSIVPVLNVANYYQRVRLTPWKAEWLNSWLGRRSFYA